MKKFQKITIIFLFCAFMCVFFIGCSASNEKQLKKCLSEFTKTFFISNQEDFNITISSGMRESDYLFDGKTTELTDFALITLTFKHNSTLEEIPFTITINEQKISDILIKNPYKLNYMFDLKKELKDDDKITINVFDKDCELISKSKDFKIDYTQAENLSIKQLKDKLSDVIKNKNSMYECYLKIAYKPEVSDNIYWYYLVKADKSYNIILDTQTGQIVAQY